MARQKTNKKSKKPKRQLAVIDFETDPFLFGREPRPFAAGFYDGTEYKQFWGDDCAEDLLSYLESRASTPLLIYAHNGGKFDFFYLLEKGALTNPAQLINGRIVKCGLLGIHELRDSYAILPIPLAKLGNKLDIDYEKLERNKRQRHKAEILRYLKADCVELYNVIEKFQARFGPKLTIGATAIAQLGKLHPISRQDEKHDETFRPYYFGGRVECFEAGELNGPFKIYDVNSMYPAAMRDYAHPRGKNYIHLGDEISNRFNFRTGKLEGFGPVYFVRCIGFNKNALPTRVNEGPEKGSLRFDIQHGEFFTCSHELTAACELGLFKVEKILDIYVPCQSQSFVEFVDTFAAEKISAKLAQKIDPENIDKHKADETFAKLILNSAYGKFATNPRKFKDWFLVDCNDEESLIEFSKWKEEVENKPCHRCEGEDDECPLCHGSGVLNNRCELVQDDGRFEIWQCPSYDIRGFYDVAVAASITSAARSILLRALSHCRRPIYCDTDSIICRDIGRNTPIDDAKIGAWKFEGMTPTIWVAGKKLYGCQLYNADGTPMIDKDKRGKPIHKEKLASKGAKLSLADIRKLCKRETVEWKSDAPNFKVDGSVRFVQRKISMNV